MDDASEDQLHDLVAAARRAGADAVEAIAGQSENTAVTVRLGKLETIERRETDTWRLRLWVGNRSASLSTTDWGAKSARDSLIERTLAMARAAPEDRYGGLAPAELVCSETADAEAALDMFDPRDLSAAELERLARVGEDAALAVTGVTNSDGAQATASRGRSWHVTSEGLSSHRRHSLFNLHVKVIAGVSGAMETAGFGRRARWSADLPSPESIGAEAGRRAAARVGSRKLPSTRAPVIFERRLAVQLLGPFLDAISGRTVARGTSFLQHQLGERVFAPGVRIVDAPRVVRGLGSRVRDGEGVLSECRALIDDGVLTSWLLDVSSARQLGLRPNGYGAAGVSNLSLSPGPIDLAGMMSQAGAGLLVTDMFGPSLNPGTGDWSAGVSGVWFERGEAAFPVSEITVAGSLRHFYARMVPASDIEIVDAANAPSLLVDAVTIAGS